MGLSNNADATLNSKIHRYLAYRAEKPLSSEVTAVIRYFLSHALGQDLSGSKLRKMGRFEFRWQDNKGNNKTGKISFDDLFEHIKANRTLLPETFGLPTIQSNWLESGIQIALPNQLGSDPTGRGITLELQLPFGKEFPLRPAIDRPGVALSSVQSSILQNISRLHKLLVETSDEAVKLDGLWFNNLRMLFNECVSILDVTLHQLYFMAKFRGKELGWKFDPDTLGPRHGVRLTDKLHWIGQITGRPLDNAEREIESFKILKKIRNHLSHFDPPCFAYTLDDIVTWLNLVPEVGRLMWKVRSKLKTQISPELISVIFLPRVEYVPPYKPHQPPEHRVGYLSCEWPEQDSVAKAKE